MHIDDIKHALEHSMTTDLEQAFRVLVDYPHEEIVRGSESQRELIDTLRLVCDALLEDGSQMPGSIRTRVCDVTGESEIGDYASGAVAIMGLLDRQRDDRRSLGAA